MHYSHLLDFGLRSVTMPTADADEGHSRESKQNTGCSDALCLRAPPVLGHQGNQWLSVDHRCNCCPLSAAICLLASIRLAKEGGKG